MYKYIYIDVIKKISTWCLTKKCFSRALYLFPSLFSTIKRRIVGKKAIKNLQKMGPRIFSNIRPTFQG